MSSYVVYPGGRIGSVRRSRERGQDAKFSTADASSPRGKSFKKKVENVNRRRWGGSWLIGSAIGLGAPVELGLCGHG